MRPAALLAVPALGALAAADLDAARAKVAADGSTSKRLFDAAVAAVPPAGVPDLTSALHASAPVASLLPAEGYFQWEVARGLHVHLDDVRVAVER